MYWIGIVAAAVILVAIAVTAPRCEANSAPGITIGGMLVQGCNAVQKK